MFLAGLTIANIFLNRIIAKNKKYTRKKDMKSLLNYWVVIVSFLLFVILFRKEAREPQKELFYPDLPFRAAYKCDHPVMT